MEGYGGAERRRSARVEDTVALKLRVISPEELDQAIAEFDQVRAELEVQHMFVDQKQSMEFELDQIKDRLPELTEYLRSVEKRLRSLAQTVFKGIDEESSIPTHKVNISADGIGFYSPEPYEPDTLLELRVQLFPSLLRVLIYGEVVRCISPDSESPQETYFIGVNFYYIHKDDRQKLLDHVQEKLLQVTI